MQYKNDINVTEIIENYVKRGYERDSLTIAANCVLDFDFSKDNKNEDEFNLFIYYMFIFYYNIETKKQYPKAANHVKRL